MSCGIRYYYILSFMVIIFIFITKKKQGVVSSEFHLKFKIFIHMTESVNLKALNLRSLFLMEFY